MKIAVAGTGYVGLSIATLLSQHHEVMAVDIIPEKVEKINKRISPIQDEYIEKYLKEKPRRRDESIVSPQMMIQIGVMGVWLVVISFLYLKLPFFKQLFAVDGQYNVLAQQQHLTGYFVLFILSALFNGFNVRDDGFGIFKRLKENPDFLKVFFIIIAVQACIVNAKRVPFVVFDWIGSMFSCVPFSMKGWIVVALLAMTMIPVDLLRKCIQNTKNR